MRRSMMAAAIALPLMVAGCAKGPGDVATRFTTAASAGDTGKALDDFDPELKQMGGMKLVAGLNQVAIKAKARGGLKSAEVGESKVDGDRGTVTIKETFGDGPTASDVEKVRKVGGRWFVTA